MISQQKKKIRLRRAVRYLYDLQKLRISTSNRDTTENVELDPLDLEFMTSQAAGLKGLEMQAEKEIKTLLKGIPIWEQWLKEQKGIGPRLGGILLAEFDVTKAPTPSSMWRYAGLGVTEGKADKMRRGDTAEDRVRYNPWLKSKMSKIMGDSFLKASPRVKRPKDPDTGKPTTDESLWIPLKLSTWVQFYDNYKNRKQNTILPTCMACSGSGLIKKEKCSNCEGTGGPAPWGRSDAHRHQAALRYMCKMFLAQFWEEWRKLEGLPVRSSYQEQYLGHDHQAIHAQP